MALYAMMKTRLVWEQLVVEPHMQNKTKESRVKGGFLEITTALEVTRESQIKRARGEEAEVEVAS
jgi:hypothetical protein